MYSLQFLLVFCFLFYFLLFLFLFRNKRKLYSSCFSIFFFFFFFLFLFFFHLFVNISLCARTACKYCSLVCHVDISKRAYRYDCIVIWITLHAQQRTNIYVPNLALKLSCELHWCSFCTFYFFICKLIKAPSLCVCVCVCVYMYVWVNGPSVYTG